MASLNNQLVETDIVIIGTGFAGLSMAIRLEQVGRHDYVVLERASKVGGTWRDNTYPGCACDVPSNLYSFSFAPNPNWTRSFSPQPEIEAYLQGCADQFGVMPRIRFDHAVTRAAWDDSAQRWTVETAQGTFRCRILISGTGPLSEPKIPALAGAESFTGPSFHTGTWDNAVELAGKRVAVIGTGASSIQVVPNLAKIAAHVDVYQRTAPWVIPRTDRKISSVEHWLYRHVPAFQRLVRNSTYWSRELYVVGLAKRPKLMRVVQKVARKHLNRQVADPQLRATLTPTFTIGCKRILISNDYYPALCQPNVDVITDRLTEVRKHGVVTADGAEHPTDVIVYGTGFHVTDLPTAKFVFGRDGQSLSDEWAKGMEAYLGSTVAGFPNLFFLIGPNSGLGHTSMVVMIEAQLTYVLDALTTMDARGLATVDVKPEVQMSFNDNLQHLLATSVWNTGGCASWYLDERGRNTTLWPTFTFDFRRHTAHFDLDDYRHGPVTSTVPATFPAATPAVSADVTAAPAAAVRAPAEV